MRTNDTFRAVLIALALLPGCLAVESSSSSRKATQCTPEGATRRAIASRFVQKGVDIEVACASMSELSCQRKVFSPTVAEGRSTARECAAPGCVSVETRTYNTAAAARGADPSYLEAGGAYNNEEVLCFHSRLQADDEFAVQGRGDTLEQALQAAQASCQKLAASARKAAGR